MSSKKSNVSDFSPLSFQNFSYPQPTPERKQIITLLTFRYGKVLPLTIKRPESFAQM